MERKTSSALLLLAGMGLAFLGQSYLFRRRIYVWDGLVFWAGAILAFGLLMGRLSQRRNVRLVGDGWVVWVQQHALRPAAAAGGAVMMLGAGLLARGLPEQADFTIPFALWALGVFAFLLAMSGLPSLRPRLSQIKAWAAFVSERRELIAGLGLLVAAALAVRAVDLEHIPANLGGDEGTWAVEGLAMWAGRLGNPFSTRWFSFPSMSFMAWGAAMQVFGETVSGVRALSAVIGAVTVLTTFALARELWSVRVAWLAAGFLTFSHYHLHFSRLAVNNIADGLLVTLALWALVKGLRLNRPGYFALAGVMVGAGWYGYFGARLLGLLVVAYAIWRWAIDREFLTQHGRSLVLLVATAIIVASPLLLHYLDHPETLATRSNQVNIISSGWLTREQEITGRSAASLLWQQVWKSISAFHYTLDPTFWYHPGIPLLDAISGIVFVLGLMLAAVGGRNPAHALVLLWICLAVLFGWILTENPPSSMRLVIVTPALALLCALGLDWLIGVGQHTLGQESRPFWTGMATTVFIAVAALNLHYYFTVYTPTRVYGNPTAEVTTRLARYLVEQDRRPVYFYGPPFIYWDFGTLRFLARDVEGADVPPVGEGGVAAHADRGARFVFLPERLSELEGVRQEFPGGRVMDTYSSADGRLLYTIYEVDPPPTSDQPSPQGANDMRSEEIRES